MIQDYNILEPFESAQNYGLYFQRANMIKELIVERALHCWEPWVEAIEDARLRVELGQNDYRELWSCSGSILNGLNLPAKLLLRLYFFSCVYSEYKYGMVYSFNDIRLPTTACEDLNDFSWSLRVLAACDAAWDYVGLPQFRYRPNLEILQQRPLPPAIWTNSDVSFALDWVEQNPFGLYTSVFQTLREIYSPYFMVLPPQHRLRQFVSKVKRRIDGHTAIEIAGMREQGYTNAEIGRKFGWKLQENEYGQRTRCSSASRYVQLGNRLRNLD